MEIATLRRWQACRTVVQAVVQRHQCSATQEAAASLPPGATVGASLGGRRMVAGRS